MRDEGGGGGTREEPVRALGGSMIELAGLEEGAASMREAAGLRRQVMVEGRQGAAREYIHGLPVPRIQGRLLLSRSWASWVSPGSLSSPCKQFSASFSLLLRLRQVSLALFLSPRPDVGLPGWLSSEGSACQGRRHTRCGFDQWAGKIPWRRRWQLIPVFLPGKSYEWSSLVGSSSWGHKIIRSNSATKQQQQWNWPLALPVASFCPCCGSRAPRLTAAKSYWLWALWLRFSFVKVGTGLWVSSGLELSYTCERCG